MMSQINTQSYEHFSFSSLPVSSWFPSIAHICRITCLHFRPIIILTEIASQIWLSVCGFTIDSWPDTVFGTGTAFGSEAVKLAVGGIKRPMDSNGWASGWMCLAVWFSCYIAIAKFVRAFIFCGMSLAADIRCGDKILVDQPRWEQSFYRLLNENIVWQENMRYSKIFGIQLCGSWYSIFDCIRYLTMTKENIRKY